MALLLLAGCGRGYAEYGPETAGAPPPGSPAAQAWTPAAPDYGAQPTETWRAADGSLRSRPAPPQPESQEAPPGAPRIAQAAPGASYPPPGAAPAPAPVPPAQAYADPAAGATGPRGSSQPGPGEVRYDEIGYAGIRPVSGGGAMEAAVVAVHRALPADSYVEVTSLDTGRTILVLVTGALGPGADHPIDLSAGAARLLGASGETIPVRIRTVSPPGFDQAALRAGRPAAERPDAPPVLLAALRKHLPAAPAASPPAYAPPRAAPPGAAAPVRAPAGRGYFVQVAALSNAARAQSLAQSMGGFVKPGGGFYRVQLGPFATPAQAEAARQRAAGAGYGDARVFAN